jgi:hypothetical protein
MSATRVFHAVNSLKELSAEELIYAVKLLSSDYYIYRCSTMAAMQKAFITPLSELEGDKVFNLFNK